MCAIPQLVCVQCVQMCAISTIGLMEPAAPLSPIPTVEHFRRSHPQCEHSYGQHIYMSEENNTK